MRIFLIALIIMALAAPVAAQGYSHEFTLELDGEWEITSNFAAPEVFSTTSLKGVGKAKMKSVTKSAPVWWDLF